MNSSNEGQDLPPRRSIGSDLLGEFPIRLPERTFVVTWLIGINCLVTLGLALAGVSLFDPSLKDVLSHGGNHGPYVSAGETWRLLSCAFVHVGILHLAFNMFALHSLRVVEGIYGSGAFLAIYLASALGASIISILWNPEVVSAGASGAVFGTAGALVAFFQAHRRKIPDTLFRPVMRNMLFLLALNVMFGSLVPGIDNAAHFGGLALGYLCARLVDREPEASPAFTLARARRLLPLIFILGPLAAAIPFRTEGAADIQQALAVDETRRLLLRSEWEASVESATRGIEADPANALLYAMRAEARLQQKASSAALADLDRALEIDPGLLDARATRMFLRWERRQNPAALEDAEVLVRRGDRRAEVLQIRAELLLSAGQWSGAQSAFDELSKGTGMERAQAELFLWITLGLQEQREVAMSRIRRYLQGSSSMHAPALEGLVAALYAGEAGEAELLEAFDRRSSSPETLTRLFYFLGAYHWVLGDRAVARQRFQAAVDRGTSDESTWLLARDALTAL